VDGGFAARALARFASIHSTERPPSYGGLALLPRSVLVPASVPDQKTKAAKRKRSAHVLPTGPAAKEKQRLKKKIIRLPQPPPLFPEPCPETE